MATEISILTDNRSADPGRFRCEHGLAARYPRVSFLTGHCTGSRAFRILQSVLGSRLQQFACGMQKKVGRVSVNPRFHSFPSSP